MAAKSEVGPLALARLGLVVSRKVGTAVMRNKFKRRVREWFRKALALPRGVDFVVIAKPGAAEKTLAELQADLDLLVRAVRPEQLA